MSLQELYPAIEAAYHTLSPVYAPAIQGGCEAEGLSGAEFYLLLALPTFEPDPISTKLLGVRGAYTSPQFYETLLISLTEKSLLECAGDGQYRLTEGGRQTIQKVMREVHTSLSGIQPLAVTEMMDLASRLKDCSDACLTAPEPPGTWCIRHTRRMDHGQGAPMMVRIEQFLTELSAFRDDAHLAAWRSYESNGHAWDILTQLWVETEMSVEELNARLKRRGHGLEETAAAVDHLAKKGWVLQEHGKAQITPFGGEIRKIAEETTNRYYYMPFKAFNDVEIKKTIDLLNKFRRSLPKS